MELFEAIHTLRAMRRLKPDPIPDDVLRQILEAAIRAPSGGNRQPWFFLSSWPPSHLPLPQPASAKRTSCATTPTPAWVHRRRARRRGVMCSFELEIPFAIVPL